MNRICLIHWNLEEGKRRAESLRRDSHTVEACRPDGPDFFRNLEAKLPACILIDLTRLPSHGRDVALHLRMRKSTRNLPLVFVGGLVSKVESIKKLLPDARYCSWEEAASTIDLALSSPPEDPVVPRSVFESYRGKPLYQKLGIQDGHVVGLVRAPSGFSSLIEDAPGSVKFRTSAGDRCDIALCFVSAVSELHETIDEIARLENTPVWIAWAKKGSAMASDLTQQKVREAGLAAGLVDYKICSIDSTWSGLLFRRRKSQ